MLIGLITYLSHANTLEAVLLPAIVAIIIALRYAKEFNLSLLGPFVIGTAESIFLSTWWDSGEALSLHVFPACALMFVAMPSAWRPTWRVGYCLTFASLLLTDLVCTLRYSIEANCLEFGFFCGVGGGGLKDALFWVPLWSAVCLAGINLATARGVATVRIRVAPLFRGARRVSP